MPFALTPAVAAAAAALLASWWILHRTVRRLQRRCLCGSCNVARTHKLRENPDGPWDNPLHHEAFTFAECRACGSFRLVKSENKCFSLLELKWRKINYPEQFIDLDESLRRAGVILPAGATISQGSRCFRKIRRVKLPPLTHISPRTAKSSSRELPYMVQIRSRS